LYKIIIKILIITKAGSNLPYTGSVPPLYLKLFTITEQIPDTPQNSLTFPDAQNSLTIPGFPDKWEPCHRFIQTTRCNHHIIVSRPSVCPRSRGLDSLGFVANVLRRMPFLTQPIVIGYWPLAFGASTLSQGSEVLGFISEFSFS